MKQLRSSRLRAASRAVLVLSAITLRSVAAHADCFPGDNMSAGGGPVAAFQHAYVVYWGWGKYGGSVAYKSTVNATFGNALDPSFGMGGSRWLNAETQYSGAPDFEFGNPFNPINIPGILVGTYADEHNVPAAGTSLTDAMVAAEVDYLVANGIISTLADNLVTVMLPPGFPPPQGAACGEHFETPGGNLAAWVVYPGSGPFSCSATTLSQFLLHELVENTTDPAVNLGPLAWTQDGNSSCEIGDLCEQWPFTVQPQPTYNASGLPSQILTQPFWSNEANSCVYSRSTNAVAFGVGTDGKLYANLVESDSTTRVYGWNSWGAPLGRTLAYSPGATAWGQGRVDAFALDTTGGMNHAWSDAFTIHPTWETLPSLPAGYRFVSPPDAVSWGAGNLQVWVTGGTQIGRLHTLSTSVWSNTYEWGRGWLGWTNWGGLQVAGSQLPAGVTPYSKVTVASPMAANAFAGHYPKSVQQVFVAFIDRAQHLELGNTFGGQISWTATSVTPEYGGSAIALSGDPEIASWSPGRLDVIVADTSGQLYDCTSTDMTTFGGVKTGAVACSSLGAATGGFAGGHGVVGMGDGRELIVGRAATVGAGAAMKVSTPAGPGSWTAMGGSFVGAIDVASF